MVVLYNMYVAGVRVVEFGTNAVHARSSVTENARSPCSRFVRDTTRSPLLEAVATSSLVYVGGGRLSQQLGSRYSGDWLTSVCVLQTETACTIFSRRLVAIAASAAHESRGHVEDNSSCRVDSATVPKSKPINQPKRRCSS